MTACVIDEQCFMLSYNTHRFMLSYIHHPTNDDSMHRVACMTGETVMRLELCNQCFMLSYTTPPLPHPTTIYSHVSAEGSTALAAIEM